MENPVESLTDAIAQRLKNPIIGTYLLSWAAWNWEIWPYTFEATPAGKKVELIGKEIYTFDGFAVPLAVTAFIVLGVPFLQAGVMWVVSKARLLQLDADARVRAASNLETEKALDARTARLDAREEALHQRAENLRIEEKDWSAKEVDRQNQIREAATLREQNQKLRADRAELRDEVQKMGFLVEVWRKVQPQVAILHKDLLNNAKVNLHSEAVKVIQQALNQSGFLREAGK